MLCDRGLMDGKAYCNEWIWKCVLDELGMNEVKLWEKWYEAVVHLMTAAEGVPEYYSTENNAAWYETLEEAW